MPRPREFDEGTAVEKAMRAFWANGYEATSTQQLCAATGLNRSSVYNTFASKHALFLRSLRYYTDHMIERYTRLLNEPGPTLDTIRDLFASVIDDECTPDTRGCFAVNTAAELGGRDPEVTEELHRHAEDIVAALEPRIRAGQEAGELGDHADARALAEYVHATVGGLRVMARNGLDRRSLDNVAEVALSALVGARERKSEFH